MKEQLIDKILQNDLNGVEQILAYDEEFELDYILKGETPLSVAIRQENLDMVALLLRNEADPTFGDGNDPLPADSALRHCLNEEVVDLVLTVLDVVDEFGLSRLHHAVILGDVNLVQDLITLGANPLLKDNEGKTPFDYLNDGPSRDEIEEILIAAEDSEDLFSAIQNSDMADVKKIVESDDFEGIDDPADMRGRTFLTVALDADEVDLDIFEYLLERGALLTSVILHQLEEFDDQSQAQLRERIQNHIHSKNEHGLTPLHRAVLSRNADSVGVYLELGSDINQEDGNGRTPIKYAEGTIADLFAHSNRSGVLNAADKLIRELSFDSVDDDSEMKPRRIFGPRLEDEYELLLQTIRNNIHASETSEELRAALIGGAEKLLAKAEQLGSSSESGNAKIVVTALIGIALLLMGTALLMSPLAPFVAAALVTNGLLTATAAATTTTAIACGAIAVGTTLELVAMYQFFSKPKSILAPSLPDQENTIEESSIPLKNKS